jgi:hypothetical protein
MKLREGRNTAHRFQVQIQIQITAKMPVNMVQHPLHPGLVVLKRRLHRPSAVK